MLNYEYDQYVRIHKPHKKGVIMFECGYCTVMMVLLVVYFIGSSFGYYMCELKSVDGSNSIG